MSRRRVTRTRFANRVDSDVQCHSVHFGYHCATAVAGLPINILYVFLTSPVQFKPLNPSAYPVHRWFNIKQFYVVPTPCICVFCVDLKGGGGGGVFFPF